MELVFEPSGLVASPQPDVEFAFAGLGRRLLAGIVNYVIQIPPVLFLLGDTELWTGVAVSSLIALLISQLALVAVTGNSLGGWVAGCVPIDTTGRTIGFARFIAREWGFWIWFSIAMFIAGIVAAIANASLRSVLREIPFLTTDLEIGYGIRIYSAIYESIGILVIAWIVRDILRSPRHQAFHDRLYRTVVVRTRGARTNNAAP